MAQWLRLCTPNAGGPGSLPGLGTRSHMHATTKSSSTTTKDPVTSLVVQWLRIRLPMQGTWVQSLVREDPTCCGATKLVCHNYWACALEHASHNYWACVPQLLKPAHLKPVIRNKRSCHNERPVHCKEEYPLLTTTRESPHAATKTQRSQISK